MTKSIRKYMLLLLAVIAIAALLLPALHMADYLLFFDDSQVEIYKTAAGFLNDNGVNNLYRTLGYTWAG